MSAIVGDDKFTEADENDALACDISTKRAPRDILESGVDELCRGSFADENGSGGLIGGFVGVPEAAAGASADDEGADIDSAAGSGIVAGLASSAGGHSTRFGSMVFCKKKE